MTEVNDKWTPLIEGIKEPLRYIVAGLVSYLLTEGVLNSLVVWFSGNKLEPAIVLLIVGLLTSFLRGWDKFTHVNWKIEEDKDLIRENDKLKGIIPF